jgi:hypothetical protein
LEEILRNVYKEIKQGLKGFSIWEKQINISNRNSYLNSIFK